MHIIPALVDIFNILYSYISETTTLVKPSPCDTASVNLVRFYRTSLLHIYSESFILSFFLFFFIHNTLCFVPGYQGFMLSTAFQLLLLSTDLRT